MSKKHKHLTRRGRREASMQANLFARELRKYALKNPPLLAMLRNPDDARYFE